MNSADVTSSVAIALHVMAAFVWLGGMFYASVALALTTGAREPLKIAPHVARELRRFFPVLCLCAAILLASSIYLVLDGLRAPHHSPAFVKLMLARDLFMVALVLLAWFFAYPRLRHGIEQAEVRLVRSGLNRMLLVGLINLILGAIVFFVVMTGSFDLYGVRM